MVNEVKEDEEDGLVPAPYYVPQSLGRLSKMDSYRVRAHVFLPENGFSDTKSLFSHPSLPPKVVLSSSNVAGYLPMTPGVDSTVSEMPPSSERPIILPFANTHLCFLPPAGPMAFSLSAKLGARRVRGFGGLRPGGGRGRERGLFHVRKPEKAPQSP